MVERKTICKSISVEVTGIFDILLTDTEYNWNRTETVLLRWRIIKILIKPFLSLIEMIIAPVNDTMALPLKQTFPLSSKLFSFTHSLLTQT